MKKFFVEERRRASILLLCLPTEELFLPHVAIPTSIEVAIRISLRLRIRSTPSVTIENMEPDVAEPVKKFVEELLKRMGLALDVRASIEIENRTKLPKIFDYVAATTEILRIASGMSRNEMANLLPSLCEADRVATSMDPGIVEALRCSYLLSSPCIGRAYEDPITFDTEPLRIEVRRVVDVGNVPITSTCLDRNTLSLIAKLYTYIATQLASVLRTGRIDARIRNLYELYLGLSRCLAKVCGSTDLSIDGVLVPKPSGGVEMVELVLEPC